MANIIKEVDEISTTDKLKAFKALKDSGLRVELGGSGVPTVICTKVEDMDKELKNVKKILKDLRYTGSFGVRGPRKSDVIEGKNDAHTDETEVIMDTEDNTEDIETLTA